MPLVPARLLAGLTPFGETIWRFAVVILHTGPRRVDPDAPWGAEILLLATLSRRLDALLRKGLRVHSDSHPSVQGSVPDDSSPDLRVADSLQDVVSRFDLQHRHLYVNRAVERITGQPVAHFIGRTNRELGMPASLVDLWEQALAQVFRSGKASTLQFAYAGPQGRHLMHSQLSPEIDGSGRVRSVVTVARDLTELASRGAMPVPSGQAHCDLSIGAVPGQLPPSVASEHYRAIVQSSEDAIISKTLSGIVTSWNAGAQRMFGYTADEIVGRPLMRIFPFDRADEERFILETLLAGGSVEHFETVRLRKDGSSVHVSVSISPIRDGEGRIVGASKIARDITRARQAEARLRLTSNVFTFANEGIAIFDAGGSVMDVNDAFCRITGHSRTDVLGRHHRLFAADGMASDGMWRLRRALRRHGQFHGEVWSRRRDGTHFAALLTVSAIVDDASHLQSYVVLFTDVTAVREQSQRLQHVAHYDALTDLPNRILLQDRLRQAIALNQRHGQSLAVLYLDLDGFKGINDTHGHHVGDELLVKLAQRVKQTLRESDTLARIGGDEFVAVLTDLNSAEDCALLVERMLSVFSEPMALKEQVVQVSVSIGVTLFPQDDADADQLIRHADQAMYQAKQSGKNRYQFFDLAQDALFKNRGQHLLQVGEALRRREFLLLYQPKVNLRTGRVFGAEALIRWQHPHKGLLTPAAFLHDIERHALNLELGDFVIAEALRQVQAWSEQGLSLSVSVNVGAWQFLQPGFASGLAAHLARHANFNPQLLELEILESGAMDDLQLASRTMQECHRLGVHFAIDDFGTGYSSLTYLKRLPAETLKIDQSFVRDMLYDAEDMAIVQGVIGLAKAFGRRVIAEGVETDAHSAMLLQLGCEQVQGYGIARPMPGAQMAAWVREWETLRGGLPASDPPPGT
jgi:diguanylate cyclase (GGDEF)-like protein/PAS domain S-box-containing protein